MTDTLLRSPRRLAALLAALLIGLGVVLPWAAQAAPPYTTTASVDSLAFTESTVREGSTARIDGTWSLPDDPESPAGFSLTLPEELRGQSDTFPLTTDDGAVMGSCVVDGQSLACDFDPDYLAEHPQDLQGTFYFWVEVATEVEEATETSYAIDGYADEVPVTVEPNVCVENCGFNGFNGWKWGDYEHADDTIRWSIEVPVGAEGHTGGDEITVSDVIGANQELAAGDTVIVQKATEVAVGSSGRTYPVFDQTVAADDVTVASEGWAISWTAEEGAYYRVIVKSAVTDGGAAKTYTNEATVTVGSATPITIPGEVVRVGGGGTGNGVAPGNGMFTLTKEVIGDAEVDPATEYEVAFTVTLPDGTTDQGTATLTAGETFESQEYPTGSIVHLEEVLPADTDTIAWSEPVLSENDFTLVEQEVTAVTVTNEATDTTPEAWTFTLTKSLDGNGADEVPADTEYTVGYSYPAGDGYEAFEGELVVRADGEAVQSEPIPADATVTLSEEVPAEIEGITWEGGEFSHSEVEVEGGSAVEVELVNSYSETEVPPTPEETPTTEAPSSEAPAPGTTPPGASVHTGGEATSSMPQVIGLALLLLGGTAVLLGVRHRRAARR